MSKRITIEHPRFYEATVRDDDGNELTCFSEVDLEINAEGYIELTYYHPGRATKCGVVVYDPDVRLEVNLPDELYNAILQGVED